MALYLLDLENKINQKLQKDEYDSVIFFSQELLNVSLPKDDSKFICKAYDNLSKSYGFLKKYDSAILYTNKMLKVALENKETETIKIAYDKLSRYLSSDKQYDKAILFSDKLYEVSDQNFDTLNMIKANFKKGLYYKEIDSLKLSYINFVASKDLYLKIKDTINAGKRLLTIAYLQKKQGNFGASQLSAIEGLRYLESTGELKTLAGLYHVLSLDLKETGKLKAAEKRNNQALDLVTDSLSLAKVTKKNVNKFKNTKANIFKEQLRYDEAIAVFKSLSNEQEDIIEKARVHANLAHTIFLKNGFNKKSDSLLQNAISVFKIKKSDSELFSALLKLGQIYKDENKQKSLAYVNLALEIAEELGNPNSILEALAVRLENEPNTKDFNRYKDLEQQLEIAEEDLNYLYANERYNYNKIENDKILAEKRTAQSRSLLLIVLLIFIVTIVLVFIIYQKIKRRHKIEKVKTVHTTEARISSKVHDELANDVYKLMTQLETSDPNREMVLDKLDAIYNNARDISKQIQNVDTGKGFADELNNLLRSYRSDDVNVLLKRYEIEIWKDITSHVKTTIYRVLQELLTNMKKHSDAVLVVVSIEKNNKKLFIQYIDNGKGFSEEISKNGLQNAENRIRAIDGSLTFDTELQKGCKFSINVPV